MTQVKRRKDLMESVIKAPPVRRQLTGSPLRTPTVPSDHTDAAPSRRQSDVILELVPRMTE
ncbi:protein of unknown function [Agrobacterium pusense]|uniref:Uncharacterized protein n=1 Tax=Agrobacterium pusense TaxID=648995 RepID=U4QD13_9HYPH|nr:protein of unknown function [Agrobacterium pusense]